MADRQQFDKAPKKRRFEVSAAGQLRKATSGPQTASKTTMLRQQVVGQ